MRWPQQELNSELLWEASFVPAGTTFGQPPQLEGEERPIQFGLKWKDGVAKRKAARRRQTQESVQAIDTYLKLL